MVETSNNFLKPLILTPNMTCQLWVTTSRLCTFLLVTILLLGLNYAMLMCTGSVKKFNLSTLVPAGSLVPTSQMPADSVTKLLTGQHFANFVRLLCLTEFT